MDADQIIVGSAILATCVGLWVALCHASLRSGRIALSELLAFVFLVAYGLGWMAVIKTVTQ